jgi:hypothetical protein
MNFILAIDPQTAKRTLYLNKSNTPKEVLKEHQITELEISTEKPQLMAALQELLDQIDQPSPVLIDEIPPVETTIHHVAAKEIEKSQVKEDFDFRQEVDDRWNDQPLAWRLDKGILAFEAARDIINPALYERINHGPRKTEEVEQTDQPLPEAP